MSRIFRFIPAAGVLLMLLGAAGTPAEADAIYTVNRFVPNPFFGKVTGELITDGTLGALDTANFLDWNLTIESILGAETVHGGASPTSLLIAFGDALTAGPDGLFFDFDEIGFLWVTDSGLSHVGAAWCVESAIGICNISDGETVVQKSVESFQPRTGIHKIATLKSTEVPEPASVLLLAAGALGVLRRRCVMVFLRQ